jgi:hypothetical protein
MPHKRQAKVKRCNFQCEITFCLATEGRHIYRKNDHQNTKFQRSEI